MVAYGLQQPAGDPSWRIGKAKGPGKEPGLHVCLAEGFTVLQQCPTTGSTSSGQDRRGTGKKTMLGPSWGNKSGMWGLRP